MQGTRQVHVNMLSGSRERQLAFPAVTVLVTLIEILIHYQILLYPSYPYCLSPRAVFEDGEWMRVFLASLTHRNRIHLAVNLGSFIFKGCILESVVGGQKFLVILFRVVVFVGLLQIGLASSVAKLLDDPVYYDICISTFGGVLLALKAINIRKSNIKTLKFRSFVIVLPPAAVSWLECAVLYAVDPQSILPLVSGILVGLLMVNSGFSFRYRGIPATIFDVASLPATYFLLSLLLGTYFFSPHLDPCVSYRAVFRQKRFLQLLLPALHCYSIYHLLYTVLSLYSLGKKMEPEHGHYGFLFLVISTAAYVNTAFCGLCWYLTRYHSDHSTHLSMMSSENACFSGLTGALLSLKILHYEKHPDEKYDFASFLVNVPYWVGIVIEMAHLYFHAPRAWVVGHLGGVLVGFIQACIYRKVDQVGSPISPVSHRYRYDVSGQNSMQNAMAEMD